MRGEESGRRGNIKVPTVEEIMIVRGTYFTLPAAGGVAVGDVRPHAIFCGPKKIGQASKPLLIVKMS